MSVENSAAPAEAGSFDFETNNVELEEILRRVKPLGHKSSSAFVGIDENIVVKGYNKDDPAWRREHNDAIRQAIQRVNDEQHESFRGQCIYPHKWYRPADKTSFPHPIYSVQQNGGNSLYTYIRKKEKFSKRQIAQTVLGLMSMFSKLAEQNVVHLDVNVYNVGINKDGTPQVFDFGFAQKIVNPEEGTTYYIPHRADSRLPFFHNQRERTKYHDAVKASGNTILAHDLWGITGILFEMVTGERFMGTFEDKIARTERDRQLQKFTRKSQELPLQRIQDFLRSDHGLDKEEEAVVKNIVRHIVWLLSEREDRYIEYVGVLYNKILKGRRGAILRKWLNGKTDTDTHRRLIQCP